MVAPLLQLQLLLLLGVAPHGSGEHSWRHIHKRGALATISARISAWKPTYERKEKLTPKYFMTS